MRCEDVEIKLNAFVSGHLQAEARLAVETHLKDCAVCRAALARVDGLAAALVRSETPPVPTGFAAQVMAAARSRQPAICVADWSPLRWWQLASMPMRAATAAVLLIGLAAGLVMGWTTRPSPVQPPDARVAVQADPLDEYNLDYLGEAPNGSLVDSYMAFVSGRNGEGR